MVLLTTPTEAELSICMVDFRWAHIIYFGVFIIAAVSWAVMKSAPSSTSEAEDKTNLMIFSRMRTELFHWGMA